MKSPAGMAVARPKARHESVPQTGATFCLDHSSKWKGAEGIRDAGSNPAWSTESCREEMGPWLDP